MSSGRTLHFYWSQLNPSRITAARELRGLTRKALAEYIGKTASAVTQFESGKIGLDISTFEKLTKVLELPPSFFALNETYSLDLGSCHFRANKNVSQLLRRRAKEYASQVINLFAALERMNVVFPSSTMETTACLSTNPTPIDIENAVTMVRKDWGLGLGPIPNLAQLLESRGAFIVLLPNEFQGIDAFSDWITEERPYIVVVGSSEPSRLQFDYGHELAHLLFHKDAPRGDNKIEIIANTFSGAFLTPFASFRKVCPTRWSYQAFLDVKSKWFLSMQAAMYRAREIGCLSDRSYRNGIFDLRGRGIHKKEPKEFSAPIPSMLVDALQLIIGEITLEELAEDIGVTAQMLEEILQVQMIPQSIIDAFKPIPKKAKVIRFFPQTT
ncbi:XRE family transcriptional regulator [Bilophila wadsworthia]|uniref:XRE family transcriptional regulator n=1 Tax=Bilophila wadsworthia TaxID=35833 RepID=UPI0032606571